MYKIAGKRCCLHINEHINDNLKIRCMWHSSGLSSIFFFFYSMAIAPQIIHLLAVVLNMFLYISFQEYTVRAKDHVPIVVNLSTCLFSFLPQNKKKISKLHIRAVYSTSVKQNNNNVLVLKCIEHWHGHYNYTYSLEAKTHTDW